MNPSYANSFVNYVEKEHDKVGVREKRTGIPKKDVVSLNVLYINLFSLLDPV